MPVPAHNGGAQTYCDFQGNRVKRWVIPWEAALKRFKVSPVTTYLIEMNEIDGAEKTRSITRRKFAKKMFNSSPAYLSGFVDGEGCFCVTFNKSHRHKFGWDICPSFSASQNSDRAEVLSLMKDYFGCGTKRPDRSDKTLKYAVRSVRDLIERIIPHFEKFPMLSQKQKEFQTFAEICYRMIRKEHLVRKGFHEIAKLAENLNAGSKKNIFGVNLKYSLRPSEEFGIT